MTSVQSRIRSVRSEDLPALMAMIAAHVAYEKAAVSSATCDGLRDLLFGVPPKLYGFVAEVGDEIVGYATGSLETSTWSAKQYMHMDCLFVMAHARGAGHGVRLLAEMCDLVHRLGVDEMQWQTPEWNDGAIRLYRRIGASGQSKVRFRLDLRPEAS